MIVFTENVIIAMQVVTAFLGLMGLFDLLVLRIPSKLWYIAWIIALLAVFKYATLDTVTVTMYVIPLLALAIQKTIAKFGRNFKVNPKIGDIIIITSAIVALYYQFTNKPEVFMAWGGFAMNYIAFNHLKGPDHPSYYGEGDLHLVLVFATVGILGFAVVAAARAFGVLGLRMVDLGGRKTPAYPYLFGLAIPYAILYFVVAAAY